MPDHDLINDGVLLDIAENSNKLAAYWRRRALAAELEAQTLRAKLLGLSRPPVIHPEPRHAPPWNSAPCC